MLANVVRLCAEFGVCCLWRRLVTVNVLLASSLASMRVWVEFDSSFGTYVCRRWSIAWLNGRGVFLAAVVYRRVRTSGGNGLLRDR